MLTRRAFVASAAGVFAAPSVWAQQRRVPRIAYLSANPPGDYRSQAFREGLRKFGYTEGRDIFIEDFLAPKDADLPEWAGKAVAGKPDLIVAVGAAGAVAAKSQTTTIPVVFVPVGDPVALGLVASLARPGANMTGLSVMNVDLAAKRLQMLQQFVPGLARVAVLYQVENPNSALVLAEVQRAGRILNIDVRLVGVKTAAEIVPAVVSAVSAGAQAFQIAGGPFLTNNEQLIVDELRKHRLPSIDDTRIHPEAGGLLSYGANLPDTFRRAAYYVDRILKGAKPQDLPVEQPMLFDLVINRKTANALGLEIPLGLLVQATEVIE
jgi:putative tryptophan/tyrosine transport system substrate-binding protein